MDKSTFNELTINQWRFVWAMLSTKSKKEAAEMIGVKPNTVYGWDKDLIKSAVDYAREQAAGAAVDVLNGVTLEAALVKAKGLHSEDERIAQAAATEILDRRTGKAPQTLQHTGADAGPVAVTVVEIIKNYDSDTDTD